MEMGISWSSALQNHSDIVRSQVGFLSLLGLEKVEHLLLYSFGSGLSGNSSFLFFLDRIQRNCCFSPLTALTLHQDLKNLLVPRKENWHLRLALLSTSLTAPWHHGLTRHQTWVTTPFWRARFPKIFFKDKSIPWVGAFRFCGSV